MTTGERLAQQAREAVRLLTAVSGSARDEALRQMAVAIRQASGDLLKANRADIDAAKEAGRDPAFLDRLRLDEKRISSMASGIEEIAALEGPVGRIEDIRIRPNGLKVGRMRIPLGVIAFIYEARPNVTSDAAALCLKSGNAVILKGGRDARRSNEVVVKAIQRAVEEFGLPPGAVQLISSSDRKELAELLQLEELIDLVIPRGGEALIRFVAEHSRIPVLKHYKGVCHVFLDKSADTAMAVEICENAKVQRPGVCNAMETLLVHRDGADENLPPVARRLVDLGVCLHGCPQTKRILDEHSLPVQDATDGDYHREYLSLDLAVRVVESMEEAIDHIANFGSDHTEAIVTSDYQRAMTFVDRVQSSCVVVNASTRFADGGQLGLGAEIGISTTRLHAYGPMGLEDLTTRKFVVFGSGQVRV